MNCSILNVRCTSLALSAHLDTYFNCSSSYGRVAIHLDHFWMTAVTSAAETSNHSTCCFRHAPQYILMRRWSSSAWHRASIRRACGVSTAIAAGLAAGVVAAAASLEMLVVAAAAGRGGGGGGYSDSVCLFSRCCHRLCKRTRSGLLILVRISLCESVGLARWLACARISNALVS